MTSQPIARSVLITGAAGGPGGATAELFAARGRQVLAADLAAPPDAPGCRPPSPTDS